MKRPSGFDRAPEPERETPRSAPVERASEPGLDVPGDLRDTPTLRRTRGVLGRADLGADLAVSAEEHAAPDLADTAEIADFSETDAFGDLLAARPGPDQSAPSRRQGSRASGVWASLTRRGRGTPHQDRAGGTDRPTVEQRSTGPGVEPRRADEQHSDEQITEVLEPDVHTLPDLTDHDSADESGGGALVAGPGRVRALLGRSAPALPTPEERARAELRRAKRDRRKRERVERRRFRTHLRRRRRPWLIALGAVVALALFVAVGVFTPIMGVREITITGTERVDEAALQEALSPQLGTPLALVEDAAVRAALAEFTLIQEFAVERVPPHTLVVRVSERRPVLSVATDGGFALLDQAGVRIEAAAERVPGFPLATGKAAEIGHPAFVAVTAALQQMPAELLAGFTGVSASTGQDIRFTAADGPDVVWGGPEKSGEKSVILASMRSALAKRPVTVIDVSSTESPVFTEQDAGSGE